MNAAAQHHHLLICCPAAAPTLRCDEAFLALTHLYLELRLPPQWALRAAEADCPWTANKDEPCNTGGHRT